MSTTARSTVDKQSTTAYRAMLGVEKALAQGSIEKPLRELIHLRVSQINGCAFCIDMHWKDARAAGESEQRLYGLSAWRESPYYSERERVAFMLAEELTRVADRSIPDEVHEAARKSFNDQELSDLAWTVSAINAWNRVNIALRTVPGNYQPPGASNK
ncbi:Alkyl hydroperoxide reductase AhpD [Pirellulimonas nuda]|uniref:Alkyl hydroperoxide reductase AhpD n=1 Tax=Pirellulimonas nuda TaxID=2528009 RepID=A0A518D709_9BACT|nr:carboxymuconolactone decarboxylase family protein [Pirellulimonas nuda]QDU87241.1 Alkyl hydroperoxide reductase AhpD [Pirellulimonas nuda]